MDGECCATGRSASDGKVNAMDEKIVKKLTWIDYTYYGLVLGLTAYTVYLIYNLSHEGQGKLRTLRLVSGLCKKSASMVGTWGMRAETAYHRIIDAERMN